MMEGSILVMFASLVNIFLHTSFIFFLIKKNFKVYIPMAEVVIENQLKIMFYLFFLLKSESTFLKFFFFRSLMIFSLTLWSPLRLC